MSRRTRALKLTLVGSSLFLVGCPAGQAPPRAVPAVAPADLGPEEERVLAAALGANAVGNAAVHPLAALPVVVYAHTTSEPSVRPGEVRRYPSRTYRRSSTFIAPYYWTSSRYHAPAVYHPGRPTFHGPRTSTATGRPATSTSTRGGFGSTGRSVSS